MEGRTTVAVSLQKEGLIAVLSVTKGGQLRVNVYNKTDQVVHLTPKTVMANVLGRLDGNQVFRSGSKGYVHQEEKNLGLGGEPARRNCAKVS